MDTLYPIVSLFRTGYQSGFFYVFGLYWSVLVIYGSCY